MVGMKHGGDIYSLREKQKNIRLDLSANINPLGMPQSVQKAIGEAIGSCHRYPDPYCRELCRAIAQKENCPVSYILCGNGAASLIYRLVFALRPQKSLVLTPSFSEYEQALLAQGSGIQFHVLREEEGFCVTERLLEDLSGELDLVFLCNPHNPTGQVIDPGLLTAIAERCEEKGIFLCLDECFQEFLEEELRFSLSPRLAEFSHLILLKAFTKIYGMAGVRLGYALSSNQRLLGKMAVCGQPWEVSSLAQAAGIAAVKETGFVEKTQALIHTEREFLKRELGNRGLYCIGSHANYLFFAAPSSLGPAMEQEGILLRDCQNYRGLPRQYYRISVRTHTENQWFLSVLDRVLLLR